MSNEEIYHNICNILDSRIDGISENIDQLTSIQDQSLDKLLKIDSQICKIENSFVYLDY